MCKECGRFFCVNTCPNYTGYIPSLGDRHRTCSCCENGIYGGEFYYVISGESLCEDCVKNLEPEELAKAFGFPNIPFLIEVLGGKYRRD